MTSRCSMALRVAALIGGACACTEPDVNAHPATYLGRIEDSDTRIAVVRAGEAIEAYVCGKGATLESHTRWFEGTIGAADGGATELANRDWRLTIELDASLLSGELIAPDGTAEHWSAARIAEDGASAVGLYDSFELGCRAGVIVWEAQPDEPCRAQGTWCNELGEVGQITPADCPAGGALDVEGSDEGEAFELTVERVESP